LFTTIFYASAIFNLPIPVYHAHSDSLNLCEVLRYLIKRVCDAALCSRRCLTPRQMRHFSCPVNTFPSGEPQRPIWSQGRSVERSQGRDFCLCSRQRCGRKSRNPHLKDPAVTLRYGE